MKAPTYWKSHYVVQTDPDEVESSLRLSRFTSRNKDYDLVSFEKGKNMPNILVSQGSGGHSYIFAELGYLMHLGGYNVFIMPKHGGFTINELIERQKDAIEHISSSFNSRIGVFGEGLGGFVTFYFALAHGHVKSLAFQNSPAILTEQDFQSAVLDSEGAPNKAKRFLLLLKALAKIVPWMRLPISFYLDWKELIDTEPQSRTVERRLVEEGYLKDPDFDRRYPLSAILSLISTPPPNPIGDMDIPTMFMVAKRGFAGSSYGDYLKDMYARLPEITKRLVEVDGSVYWMLSHPREAARVICNWFDETL